MSLSRSHFFRGGGGGGGEGGDASDLRVPFPCSRVHKSRNRNCSAFVFATAGNVFSKGLARDRRIDSYCLCAEESSAGAKHTERQDSEIAYGWFGLPFLDPFSMAFLSVARFFLLFSFSAFFSFLQRPFSVCCRSSMN